jgi:deoxyribodipyrimidine photo-lyase
MNEGTPQARPYTVLSHYFNKFVKDAYSDKSLIRKPEALPSSTQFVPAIVVPSGLHQVSVTDMNKFYKKNPNTVQKGGRSNGVKIFAKIPDVYKRYSVDRHYPAKTESTNRISAHLKFGTVSIREFFWKILDCSGGNIQNDLTREIVFRSFYFKIWTHQSELQRDKSFHQYIDDEIPWKYPKDDPEKWKAWLDGKTGYPMADAGMRQLMHENFVHGRPRMVLATVACRYLLFDNT